MLLQFNQVNKTLGYFKLKDISFSLGEGLIMGLIGENGAGKTTIVKLITSLLTADSGEITLFGKVYNAKNSVEIRDQIGFVFDDPSILGEMYLRDLAKVFAQFYSTWDQDQYQYLVEKLRINDMMKLPQLSRGNQMKAQIILALSHHAKLIVMDEPSNGLDPIVRHEMLQILREYVEKTNASILFSSHITTDLEELADYITFIQDGKVVFSKSIEDLRENLHIVQCSSQDFKKIPPTSILAKEEKQYYIKALTNTKIPLSDAQWTIPTLDNIMYFYHLQAQEKKGRLLK